MPNLIPQSVLDRWFFGWAHPAGRLIFSLLAIAIGLAFVFALIRPPLPRKILRPKQGVPLAIGLTIGCYIIGGAVPGVQILMVWTIVFGGRRPRTGDGRVARSASPRTDPPRGRRRWRGPSGCSSS